MDICFRFEVNKRKIIYHLWHKKEIGIFTLNLLTSDTFTIDKKLRKAGENISNRK